LHFTSGSTLQPTSLRLKDEHGANDAPDDLNMGSVVVVEHASEKGNQMDRDLVFAPVGGKRFITHGYTLLRTWFDEKFGSGVKEFRIGGPAGTGKSCAAMIIAADIARKKPDSKVYYFREWDITLLPQVSSLAKSEPAPVYFVVDQVDDNKHAQALAKLAAYQNTYMIMISSANLSQFSADREGSQHRSQTYNFPFSASGADCLKLAQMLAPQTYPAHATLEFEPKTILAFDDLEVVSVNENASLADICKWTNGHLLSIASLLSCKETSKNLLASKITRMSTYFTGDAADSEKPAHPSFYLHVVKMCNDKATCVSAADKSDFDLRYVNTDGQVLSYLLLQALQQSVALCSPPATMFTSVGDLLNANPSELGFIIERECLQNSQLLKVASTCLGVLREDEENDVLPLDRDRVVRIGYRDLQQIVNEVKGRHEAHADDVDVFWGIHALPLAWNEPKIDCIQLYYVNGTLYIIGNQITAQSAQEHVHSIAWINELDIVKSKVVGVMPGVDVRFVLLFTAWQPDNNNTLRVSEEHYVLCEDRGDFSVMDYPIRNVLSPTTSTFLKQDQDLKMQGARLLKTVKSQKRKLPQGCGCKKSKCASNRCGCKNNGTKCADDCSCVDCNNK
jgi:hypothetical protein